MKLAIVTLNKASIAIGKSIKVSTSKNKSIGNLEANSFDLRTFEEVDIYSLSKYLEEGVKPIVGKLKAFSKDLFDKYDCIIYVMAMGIIVRDIAPYLNHKSLDPAVLCVSVDGRFVIPVLSGHLGGANEIAEAIGQGIQAVPVITTASDLLGVEAVDLLAKRNNLLIDSFKSAMDLTARMINNESIKVISDLENPIKEADKVLTNELDDFFINDVSQAYIYVGFRHLINTNKPLAKLISKSLIIGIGARRDTSFNSIYTMLDSIFVDNNLDIRAIKSIKSIDIKQDEEGIIQLARELNVSFETYSGKDLNEVSHLFEESDFVKKITGVGCVSMPSGYLGSNKGKCIVEKQVNNGITMSVWEEI